MTPANDHDRKSGPGLGHTVWMRTEVDRFQRRFQRQSAPGAPLPVCTWEQLERQLENLASSEALRAAIPDLIVSVRKQSQWLPNEMILREILCAAFAVMECDVTIADVADLHRA
jgi:hypothetical protein